MILLAQGAIAGTVGYWVIIAIVIAAILGIGLVVLRTTGIAVPPWVMQIVWICVVAVIAVLAIKVVLSFM